MCDVMLTAEASGILVDAATQAHVSVLGPLYEDGVVLKTAGSKSLS